jgi:hypothetical protein
MYLEETYIQSISKIIGKLGLISWISILAWQTINSRNTPGWRYPTYLFLILLLVITIFFATLQNSYASLENVQSLYPPPSFGRGYLTPSQNVTIMPTSEAFIDQGFENNSKELIEESFESVTLPGNNTGAVGPESNETATRDPIADLPIQILRGNSFQGDELGMADNWNLFGGDMGMEGEVFESNQTDSFLHIRDAIHAKAVQVPNQFKNIRGETSVSSYNNIVFYTGNTFAARSVDSGTKWDLINPASDMKDFCCDQVTIFDPNHEIFVWYRQGASPNSEFNAKWDNRIRLGISHDAFNWTMYDFTAKTLNSQMERFQVDYPQISIGNDYLYITSNMIEWTDYNKWQMNAIMLRISLNDLSNLRPAEYSFFYGPNIFTFSPVQGATDKMYWATNLNREVIRIYELDESEPVENTTWFDRPIPKWSYLKGGNEICGDNSGISGARDNNWCGKADSRITAGWLANNLIGFFWNADPGGITQTGKERFNFPYINAATFDISDNMSYIGRPYIWSQNYAWLYPSVAVNDGEVSLIAYFGNGQEVHPSLTLGISNNMSNNEPWNMILIESSNYSPKAEKIRGNYEYNWGDYVTLRSQDENNVSKWYAAGFVLKGGQNADNIKPYYYIIDKDLIDKYINCIRNHNNEGSPCRID